jgi:predicted nucleotidyltransferase
MIDLARVKPDIMTLCSKMPVKRLDFFGSILTDAYGPDSDADVLVVFDPDDHFDYFTKYFELKEGLEGILKREVDLIVDKTFRNPVFRRSIERTRMTVYER